MSSATTTEVPTSVLLEFAKKNNHVKPAGCSDEEWLEALATKHRCATGRLVCTEQNGILVGVQRVG